MCTKIQILKYLYTGSRILVRKISLRFLGIILQVLRLEVSEYIVYITDQFQATFAGGWGGESVSRGDCE